MTAKYSSSGHSKKKKTMLKEIFHRESILFDMTLFFYTSLQSSVDPRNCFSEFCFPTVGLNKQNTNNLKLTWHLDQGSNFATHKSGVMGLKLLLLKHCSTVICISGTLGRDWTWNNKMLTLLNWFLFAKAILLWLINRNRSASPLPCFLQKLKQRQAQNTQQKLLIVVYIQTVMF